MAEVEYSRVRVLKPATPSMESPFCFWKVATASAIVPVIVGDERRAVAISQALETEGFIVSAIRYPTVAKGAARLRFAVSSAHAEESLMKAASAISAKL